jgi:hypothetical protein
MAITQYTITGSSWTAITAAGKNCTIWMDEDGDGEAGAVDVRIMHSVSGAPAAGDVSKGKRLHKSNSNTDILSCVADNALDIVYARCLSGSQAIISVDSPA